MADTISYHMAATWTHIPCMRVRAPEHTFTAFVHPIRHGTFVFPLWSTSSLVGTCIPCMRGEKHPFFFIRDHTDALLLRNAMTQSSPHTKRRTIMNERNFLSAWNRIISRNFHHEDEPLYGGWNLVFVPDLMPILIMMIKNIDFQNMQSPPFRLSAENFYGVSCHKQRRPMQRIAQWIIIGQLMMIISNCYSLSIITSYRNSGRRNVTTELDIIHPEVTTFSHAHTSNNSPASRKFWSILVQDILMCIWCLMKRNVRKVDCWFLFAHQTNTRLYEAPKIHVRVWLNHILKEWFHSSHRIPSV